MIAPHDALGGNADAGLPPGSVQNTANDFGVVRIGDNIQVLYFRQVARNNSFTLQGAVLLAAWLAVLAYPELKEFQRVVKEIKK